MQSIIHLINKPKIKRYSLQERTANFLSVSAENRATFYQKEKQSRRIKSRELMLPARSVESSSLISAFMAKEEKVLVEGNLKSIDELKMLDRRPSATRNYRIICGQKTALYLTLYQ